MKYYGEFRDINDVLYRIEINTKNSGADKELKLSGTPFVSTIESEDKHIYSPIRCGGATIGLLCNDYIPNFYASGAKDVKVTLTNQDTNKIEWIGYVVPSIYSQGWDCELEELQLDCIDGIAVLKDIKYSTSDNNIKSIDQIINHCLYQSGCFKDYYISANIRPQNVVYDESIFNMLEINDECFFADRESPDQTDDDIAWSCFDVLYQICQWLGMTIVTEGTSVYIIDYDALKKGNNKYGYRTINETSPTFGNSVNLSYSKFIDGADYSQNGTSIEMDDVYNKITVKDDFSTFESSFPEFGDISTETNITVADDNGWQAWQDYSGNGYMTISSIPETDSKGRNNNYQIFVVKGWRDRRWIVCNKFYESPVFEFKKYDNLTLNERVYNEESWFNFWYSHGAYYVRQYKKEISSSDYNNWRAKYGNFRTMSKEEQKKAWLDLLNMDPSGVNFTPMIILNNRSDNHIGPGGIKTTGKYDVTDNEDCRKYPFIKLKGTRQSSIFGGENAYLIIQGSFIQHDEQNTPFPLSDGGDNGKLHRKPDYKYNDQFFIWARLKWGMNYWNGEGWTSQPSDFKLWFLQNHADGGKTKVEAYFDKTFDIINTAQIDFAASDKGYYIPAPPNGNLSGEAEFTIYCPRDFWGRSNHNNWHDANRYNRYYNYITILKNFSVKAYINTNGSFDDGEADSDTCYTNVINDNNVNDLEEISFKITTDDNKNPNYSSVQFNNYFNGYDNKTYVKELVNIALENEEKGTIGCDGVDGVLRQEEHYVYKLTKQYSEPRIILNCNLRNEGHKLYGTFTDKTLSGKTFIATEREIDYKMNSCTLKLVEKA